MVISGLTKTDCNKGHLLAIKQKNYKVKAGIEDIIIRFLSSSISEEEKITLKEWLEESAENRAYFEKQRTVWIYSGTFGYDMQKRKNRIWKKIVKENPNARFNRRINTGVFKLVQFRVAASILLIAIGTGAAILFMAGNFRFGNINFANSEYYLDTLIVNSPRGSRTELYLPDGSYVFLNGNSQIKFLPGFKKGKREVFLSGEAYFKVESTPGKDNFYVYTTDLQINVLGTSFNIKAYPEERIVETILEEGLISLKKRSEKGDSKSISLSPEQQAVFIRKHGRISSEKLRSFSRYFNVEETDSDQLSGQFIVNYGIDTELFTAWKDGHLVFQGENFQSILFKFERWYDVDIKLENKRLENIKFSANFENETIDQALYALSLTHTFQYFHDIKNNTIHIK